MKIRFKKKIYQFVESLTPPANITLAIDEGEVRDLPGEIAMEYLMEGSAHLADLGDIAQIKKEDTDDFEFIGNASGANLQHCIFMAIRHQPNFREEVIGFCVEKWFPENDLLEPQIEISFWKAKK